MQRRGYDVPNDRLGTGAERVSKLTTVVDLFCGAGGLGAGLHAAGLETIHAVDSLPAAVRTYGMNFAKPVSLRSLCRDAELPPADVIVGGPPCQGFSSAGQRRLEDSRNSLVAVFAHLVARHRPGAFVFENVEGFLTGEDGRYLLEFLDTLAGAGYCMHLRKVNAAHYGIPQHRKRVIVVGGLGWDPGFPPCTHRAVGMPGATRVGHGLPPCPTVDEALRGLPAAEQRPSSKRPPSDHSYRAPRDADLARYRALAPGETMKDLPEELWHPTFRRRAFRRVMDGTPSERRGGPPAGLRRLRGDQPAKAITSGAATEFVHPVEPRLLTLRECARLQTFPDSFRFAGTQAERALLIGNAVPPLLGEVLGRHLKRALGQRSASETPASPGLKSFVATTGTAMSPALRRAASAVEARYLAARQPQLSLFA